MSTESLSHIAAALDITVSGSRNMRFKLRAALRAHLNIEYADSCKLGQCLLIIDASSVADFFSSFESHRKPALVAIAAFHRIALPPNATTEQIRTRITEHIVSRRCLQFSEMHASTSLPEGTSVPDCRDVIHVLTALNGSNLNLLPLRRLLSVLKIEHNTLDTLRDLRKKLKTYIGELRKGKRVEQVPNNKLRDIVDGWPQLVPSSIKDKLVYDFREQTSSESLSMFTVQETRAALISSSLLAQLVPRLLRHIDRDIPSNSHSSSSFHFYLFILPWIWIESLGSSSTAIAVNPLRRPSSSGTSRIYSV
ncbi:hypothetical protein R3P38DRAFT_3213677 [Favolaschia claudopus]|uniref:Uncharacterized protein n=1 Tax=Favolaschia claudopus TaxID=2862362 RepID=A0AAW0ADC1_9AGAR